MDRGWVAGDEERQQVRIHYPCSAWRSMHEKEIEPRQVGRVGDRRDLAGDRERSYRRCAAGHWNQTDARVSHSKPMHLGQPCTGWCGYCYTHSNAKTVS